MLIVGVCIPIAGTCMRARTTGTESRELRQPTRWPGTSIGGAHLAAARACIVAGACVRVPVRTRRVAAAASHLAPGSCNVVSPTSIVVVTTCRAICRNAPRAGVPNHEAVSTNPANGGTHNPSVAWRHEIGGVCSPPTYTSREQPKVLTPVFSLSSTKITQVVDLQCVTPPTPRSATAARRCIATMPEKWCRCSDRGEKSREESQGGRHDWRRRSGRIAVAS